MHPLMPLNSLFFWIKRAGISRLGLQRGAYLQVENQRSKASSQSDWASWSRG